MKTIYDGISMRTEPFTPKYPLGFYLKRWANMRGISQIDMAIALNYTPRYKIWEANSVSLKKFFLIIEYLSNNSSLPEEFYYARLKQVLQGEYKWRN